MNSLYWGYGSLFRGENGVVSCQAVTSTVSYACMYHHHITCKIKSIFLQVDVATSEINSHDVFQMSSPRS